MPKVSGRGRPAAVHPPQRAPDLLDLPWHTALARPAELSHQLLEHRYYLSEAAGHEVDNQTALQSYLASVLLYRPDERVIFDDEK